MRPRLRRLRRHLGILAVLVAVAAACNGTDRPRGAATTTSRPISTTSTTTTTTPPAPGTPVAPQLLEWGECFDIRVEHGTSETNRGVTSTTVFVQVDCTDPHENQVFSTLDHPADPGTPYPGARELLRFARAECAERFEPFVGHEFPTSRFDLEVITPTEREWNEGSRRIVCYLFDVEGSPITGSAAGSGE